MFRILFFVALIFKFSFAYDICTEQYMKEWIDRMDTAFIRQNTDEYKFGKSKCINNTIIINSYLNFNGNFTRQEKDEFTQYMTNIVCNDNRYELIADLGLLIKMNIFSKNKNLIHQVNINPKKCLNFSKSYDNICGKQYIINQLNIQNSRAPLFLDEITVLRMVYCQNNTYIYRIDLLIDNISNILEIKNEMQNYLLNDYCTNPSFGLLRKLGVSIKSNYHLQNGRFLFTTTASPSNCLNY